MEIDPSAAFNTANVCMFAYVVPAEPAVSARAPPGYPTGPAKQGQLDSLAEHELKRLALRAPRLQTNMRLLC